MLFIFAGYPRCGLNAGGLQHAVEEVEELAILEHRPAVRYDREGIVAVGPGGFWERVGATPYVLSPSLEAIGITWDWFPENWSFGNGVTVHKTTACRETEVIDHGSGRSLSSLMAAGQPVDMSRLVLRQAPRRTEGWKKYEARWRPGTCPQESHVVHLTWLVARHFIPLFAYDRIREIIEAPDAEIRDQDRYEAKHFSPTRPWRPQPAAPHGMLAGGIA